MTDGSWSHIDLFSGPGGFGTGLAMAGFRPALALDIHEPSVATYRHNHPGVAVITADIREVSIADVQSAAAGHSVGVITAGVPCEGFSMSNRNRNRFVDERNFLFIEFLRIVEAVRPPYIVLENVSALTRHSEGFFKSEIEAGMERLGYIVSSRVLDALQYGVPQRRRRVFFVGHLEGWSYAWPRPTHGYGLGLQPPVTVWEAIGDLPELGNDEQYNEYLGAPSNPFARAMRGSQEILLNHRSPKHPAATIAMIDRTTPGEPMYERFRQRIRLHPDRPSPTVVSGGIRPQFHYGHPTQPRGLSIRERARLQSFPDRYYFEGGLVQGRVQTGDAVPPLLANAVGQKIAAGLNRGQSEIVELARIPVSHPSEQVPLFESLGDHQVKT